MEVVTIVLFNQFPFKNQISINSALTIKDKPIPSQIPFIPSEVYDKPIAIGALKTHNETKESIITKKESPAPWKIPFITILIPIKGYPIAKNLT